MVLPVWTYTIRTARSARRWRSGTTPTPESVSTAPRATCEPASTFQRPRHPASRSTRTTASRRGEFPDMHTQGRYFSPGRTIGALILIGAIALGASGCYDSGGYYGGDYPSYGYAPYSYGFGGGWGNGWGYSPGFDVHHSWEDHWGGGGHHTEFYHGGGGGFHAGGGFHGGGGGGHGGGGHR